MSTCLFTNEVTGPGTREEHTILRGLAGRFRSRTSSSSSFNNACSKPFDAELVAAYSPMMNVLAPLLSAEHQPGSLRVEQPQDGGRVVLAPGAVPRFPGIRIDVLDPVTGRPAAISAEAPARLEALAAQLGWPRDRIRWSTVASTTEEVLFHKVPTLSPAMEVAVLKSALLTFDHLLGGREDAFTRAACLQELRQAIVGVVRDGAPAAALLGATSWGIDPDAAVELATIRQLYGPPATSRFEHVLFVSGARRASLDLYVSIAGIDVYRYRLTERWTGNTFGLLAGCGMLVGDHPFGPIEVLRRLPFRDPTQARAVVVRGTLESYYGRGRMNRITAEIGRRRHAAILDAISLVEHRADEFVKDQLAQLARIEPALDIEGAVRGRLGRLYPQHREDAAARGRFDAVIASGVAEFPPGLRGQRFPDIGWEIWLPKYRSLVRTLETVLGPPGTIIPGTQHAGYGTASPVR